MGRLWRVVGGDKGGLLVRDGRELTSAEKAERLAKQSIVEEVEIAGPRLCYRICRGTGPETGWVSMKLKDKHLLVPADTRETGKRFSAETPLPELLCVQPSVKHGTERGALATLDELEQKAWAQVKETNSSMNSGKEALEDKMVRFKSTVQDLLHVAWKRENRKRVVLFLAKLLEFCSKNNWTRAAQILCHQLCLVSWASSMVDVEYYPFRDDAETNPMVLLCGFGGSHLDDLQPAIEQWTKRGAAVLAFGPALVGREDMLERIYEKLMEVLGGHPVILHFFSDGGFGMARSLLGMWNESWQHGQTRQSPAETIKCIISDGAGLLPHETTYIEDIQGGKGEPTTTTNTALAFFTGCGLNMLMTFGACQAFHEELGFQASIFHFTPFYSQSQRRFHHHRSTYLDLFRTFTLRRISRSKQRSLKVVRVGSTWPFSFCRSSHIPRAPSSFLFLVVRPGAPSSVLAPSSDARSP